MSQSKQRRSLENRGGAVSTSGRSEHADMLRAAWQAGDTEVDTLTHGFHTYPARMHPGVARVLIGALTSPGDALLDPFCGGGTVLVEGMVAGRVVHGIDLNPVAIRVARVRCERRDGAGRERFSQQLKAVVEGSMERITRRAHSRAPLSPAEAKFYAPHVVRELGGLFEEIAAVQDKPDKKALEVLLSAIVVKFSQQGSDQSRDEAGRAQGRRIGKRIPTKFFSRKGEELGMRWEALDAACADVARFTPPRIVEGDAREAARLLPRGAVVQAIVCSPPYGGTYDYAEHHARRYPWLGVSPKRLRADEIGARRTFAKNRYASRRWDEEVGQMLASMASVLSPDGKIAIVTGDAQLGTRRVDASRHLATLARAAGLSQVAAASQSRPDWHGGPPRREHIVLLERRGEG